MGTNVVKKGANRGSHNARTTKAAQRTALPPKASPGVERTAVPVIKEEVAVVKAQKARKVATASKTAPSKPPKAEYAKAAEFVRAAEQVSGWDLQRTATGPRAEVTGTRGGESFHIAWNNNVYERWAGYLASPSSKEKRISNAKSMLGAIGSDPGVAAAKAAQAPAASRLPRRTGPLRSTEANPPVELPWGPESTDPEILTAVKGRKITWRNTLATHLDGTPTMGSLQESRVPKDEIHEREVITDGKRTGVFEKVVTAPRHLKIERSKDGTRVISFASMEGGFRSVAETAILSVR